MNETKVLAILQTMIFLGKGALSAVPGGAQFQIIADGISAAIAELQKVVGSDVTKQQLEGLRTKAQW